MHTKKQLMVKKYELYFYTHTYIYTLRIIYYTQFITAIIHHTKVQLRFRLS